MASASSPVTPAGTAIVGTVTKDVGGRLYIRRVGSSHAKVIQVGTRINVGDQLLTSPTRVRALVFESSQGRVAVNQAAHVSVTGGTITAGGKLSKLTLVLNWVTTSGTKMTNYTATIEVGG